MKHDINKLRQWYWKIKTRHDTGHYDDEIAYLVLMVAVTITAVMIAEFTK